MPPRGAPSIRDTASSVRGRGGPTDSPNIGAHVTTLGVKRPNFGSGGRDLAIHVNSFRTKIPESVIHHYDGKESCFSVASRRSLMLPPSWFVCILKPHHTGDLTVS